MITNETILQIFFFLIAVYANRVRNNDAFSRTVICIGVAYWKKLILLFNANYFNIFPFMSVQNMFNQIFVCVFFLFSSFLVSRLMGGSASGSMGHMGNMGSLAACSVSDSKPMQFPLAQRRKRRVLFTQAQVCPKEMLIFILVYSCSCDLLFYMS